MAAKEKIVEIVCKYYAVEEDLLKGQQRSEDISEPRQVAMYLLRKMLGLSLPEIGKLFDRDYTTVLSAFHVVEKKRKLKENGLRERLEKIEEAIKSAY